MNSRKQLERLILEGMTEADCPEPDQLSAYISGTLSSQEQLLVAAHVRSCPLCEADLLLARPPVPRRPVLIARLLPMSLQGVRTSSGLLPVRHYRAANLAIEIAIIPTPDARWRISGQLVRAAEGVPATEVVLRRSGRITQRQPSNQQGFFTFETLAEGRYTLTVVDDETVVQIRGIHLVADDL